MKRPQALLGAVCVLSVSLLVFTTASAQNRFPHAIERSGDASRIIASLALVPESGLPKELVDKAEAVGVFPKVERETLYFTHTIEGYGVISARTEGGWTMPAFYQFSGAGFGNPFA